MDFQGGKIMNDISFEIVKNKIPIKKIKEILEKKEKSGGYVRAVLISCFIAIVLSLPATNYFWIFSAILFGALCIIFYRYTLLCPLFKVLDYNKLLFFIWQTAAIFFLIVFLVVRGDKYNLIPLFYIIFSYTISFFIMKIQINSYLEREYHVGKKATSRINHFFDMKLTKGLVVFLSTIIAITMIYRVNKSWMRNIKLTTGDPSILEYTIWSVVLLGLLAGFTFLPNLLFSPADYVKGKLMKKYSEEFRQEYGFSKEEWYGE